MLSVPTTDSVDPDSSVRPDAIAAALHRDILAPALPSDAPITEAYVSRAYSVARPTARIAIDRLVTEGILVREPHHAARINRLGRDDIDDLFISRAALESTAAELLAARGGVIPGSALAAHHALLRLDQNAPYTLDDTTFHHALVCGAGAARLARLHQLLMGEIELCIAQIEAHQLRSIAEVAAEHQRILDSIASGEADEARQYARDHVLSSRDRLVAHYDATHGR